MAQTSRHTSPVLLAEMVSNANIDLGYSPDPLSMSLARMLEALNNRSWLMGSDIEATWVEVKRLEHKAEQVRSQMSQAKNSYCKSHAQLMRLTLQIEDDTSASTFDTFAH